MNDSLQLNMFFPSELLSINSVDFDDSSVHIKMQSKTHSCKCPECGQETETYHVFTPSSGSTDTGKNCTTSYNSSRVCL